MVRFLEKLSAGLRARWMCRSIYRALALNRYEVRPDGLCPERMSFRLVISWRARQIHPWDSDVAPERKALRLVEQTFSDTEAALEQLFMALPEIDTIDLTVLEADARKHGVLMSASISRRGFEICQSPSSAMRLRLLGVNYNLVNCRFEPLPPACPEHETPNSGIDNRHPEQSYEFAEDLRGPGTPPSQPWHRDKTGPH